MTQVPNDDSKLTEFLRCHRPEPPIAASTLEDQIMAAVEVTPFFPGTLGVLERPATHEGFTPKKQRQWIVWLVPSAIVASVLLVFLGHRQFSVQQAQQRQEELAQLESFLERNWNGAVNDAPNPELFPAQDSTNNSTNN